MYKRHKLDPKRRSCPNFKKNIIGFLTALNESYNTKVRLSEEPLPTEKEAHCLFNEYQDSEERYKRYLQQRKEQAAVTKERSEQMHSINAQQGLTPVRPTPTTQPTQQTPTASASTTIPYSLSYQSYQSADQNQRRRVDSSATFAQSSGSSLVFTIADDDEEELQLTGGQGCGRPDPSFGSTRLPRPGFQQRAGRGGGGGGGGGGVVQQRPAACHLDMVDRIDEGRTITSDAMREVQSVLQSNCARGVDQAQVLASAVMSFFQLPGVAGNPANADGPA